MFQRFIRLFKKKKWAVVYSEGGYVERFWTKEEALEEVERYRQEMLIWENMGIPTILPRVYKI